jgi:hypothetical protein
MKKTRAKLPPGWRRKSIREVIDYYDHQTDEQGAAEIETTPAAAGTTWMSVPTELVPAVARLIEDHAALRRPRKRSATTPQSKNSHP